MGDGSIPEAQQVVLRNIGQWMKANGSALNGTRPWSVYGEGPTVPNAPPADWRGGSSSNQLDYLPPRRAGGSTEADFRFTSKGETLYAIGMRRPATGKARIKSLGAGRAHVEKVTLLETGAPLAFEQTADALLVQIPASGEAMPYALAIQGNHALGE